MLKCRGIVRGSMLVLMSSITMWSPLRAQNIPITFTLEEDGYLTLVVEDASGRRVRNLIQETYFPAGTHTIYWDGYDEGQAINRNRPEGNYDIERFLVLPGTYRVRGLFHRGIDLRYEFSVQSPGQTPWHTDDRTGGWLSDHQSAWDVTWLPPGYVRRTDGPALLFISKTGEAGHGIVVLDENGRKIDGKQSLPGGFLAGHNVARDVGTERDRNVAGYMAVEDGTEVRVYAYLSNGGAQGPLFTYPITSGNDEQVRGLAVRDRIAIVALNTMNRLVVGDLRTGRVVAVREVDSPRGLFATEDGKLYVVSGPRVLRYDVDVATGTLTEETVIVGGGLEDPQGICVAGGEVYVADWGTRHQVLVFGMDGTLHRTIGTPGGPQIGPYDETRMGYPRGVAVDSRGMLWVAERHRAPKRISRWQADTGAFDRAWYGPPKYGGGGMIDPKDPTRFYYAQSGKDAVKRAYEFELDWTTGAYRVRRILLDDEHFAHGVPLPYRAPEYPRYRGGRQYMVNNNQEEPNGNRACAIWLYENERLWPAAVAGIVSVWPVIQDLGTWAAYDSDARRVFFVWSDLDRDGLPEQGEVQYHAQRHFQGTCFVEKDLSITTIWGDKVPAPEVLANGIPRYDLAAMTTIAPDEFGEDKDSYHLSDDSLFVSFLGPLAFFRHGERIALYHSQWPNRNLGGAPVPVEQYPGQLLETARPLGDFITPGEGEAGPIFGINSDYGQAYVFTWDGLFLTKLLEDSRTHPLWRFPEGTIARGDRVEGVSGDAEHFWPTLNGTDDGEVYFVAGKEHSSILRVEGLETVRRVDVGTVEVTSEQVAGKASSRVDGLPAQERLAGEVRLWDRPPAVDGALDEWAEAAWLDVDAALGIRAALVLQGDSLYLALHTGMPDLLDNAALDGPGMDMSTGGGIDLWVGAPGMTEERTQPVPGDKRLFITRQGDPYEGPVRATLFEQVRPEAGDADGITYTSPIDEVHIDYVADVSERVALRQVEGDFEVAIPLDLLGIEAVPGLRLSGDVGVLFGDGQETRRRLYWNNKTQVIVADLPGEARFTPAYWGTLTLVPGGQPVGVDGAEDLPARFTLDQAYPNPFRDRTTIRYSLPRPVEVTLEVFDLLGRRVATLVDEQQAPGRYEVLWTPDVASGLYLYRLRAGDFVEQKTVLRVR